MYFWSAACLWAIVHFVPVGNPPPPRPAQPALLDLVAHLGRRHRAERLRQRRVAAAGEVLVDAGRDRRCRSWPAPSASAARRTDARRGPARRATARCPPGGTGRAASIGRRPPREHGVQQRRDLLLGDLREAQARPPGQLDVDQRFFDAQADAADLDDVGLAARSRRATSRTAASVLRGAGAEAARARADEDHRAGRRLAPQRRELRAAIVAGTPRSSWQRGPSGEARDQIAGTAARASASTPAQQRGKSAWLT